MKHSTTISMLCVPLAAALLFGCTTKFESNDTNEEDLGEISPDSTEDTTEPSDDAGPETIEVPDTVDAPDTEAEAVCGNHVQEPGEDCDDGNTIPDDGCKNNCTWTCINDSGCGDDGIFCNGEELCRLGSHTCEHENIPTAGTECPGEDYCRRSTCNASQECVPGAAIPLLHDVVQIASGYQHTCALIQGGGVKCWGDNQYGQVGDDTTEERHAPVNVVNLRSGVIMLAAGGWHTCAVMAGGGMQCWGNDDAEQLGNGPGGGSFEPVDVVGLPATPITAVAAGGYHTCILLETGGVKCWGGNTDGQLGMGDTDTANRDRPVDVPDLTAGVAAIAAGRTHTCAVMTDGTMKCWGSNYSGQLGNGATTPNPTCSPVVVMNVTDASKVTAGGIRDGGSNPLGHTCIIRETNGAMCWGNNSDGQLGNGDTLPSSVRVQVEGLTSGVSQISAGGLHTCALMDSLQLKCWGRNTEGQLGIGTTASWSEPQNVSGSFQAVSLGQYHTCALTPEGSVKCWGQNNYGQLGNNNQPTNSTSPIDVLCKLP